MCRPRPAEALVQQSPLQRTPFYGPEDDAPERLQLKLLFPEGGWVAPHDWRKILLGTLKKKVIGFGVLKGCGRFCEKVQQCMFLLCCIFNVCLCVCML